MHKCNFMCGHRRVQHSVYKLSNSSARQRYEQFCSTEFHQNQTTDVGSMD